MIFLSEKPDLPANRYF